MKAENLKHAATLLEKLECLRTAAHGLTNTGRVELSTKTGYSVGVFRDAADVAAFVEVAEKLLRERIAAVEQSLTGLGVEV